MVRRLRIHYPDAIYHVINRGNYRRDLFATAGAANAFEVALGEASLRHGWLVHAFAIMSNHFHVALTTPTPNLGEGMHWLQTTFALRFNRFRSESGHLFQGRYQAPLIEDASALVGVVDYIHLNPVRAGLAPAGEPARYTCGSLSRFVHGPRPKWLSPDAWLTVLGLDDSTTGWTRYADHLAQLVTHPSEQTQRDFADISRGRPIGTAGWKRALACEHQHRALEPDLPREETRLLKETRWTAALECALSQFGIAEDALLATSRKIPQWKIAVACLVRRSSGAPYHWIAENLHIGNSNSIRLAVCRAAQSPSPSFPSTPKELQHATG